jgi:hypothetical protein
MTVEELAQLLNDATDDFRRSPTHWQFIHEGIPMACLTDLGFDRMRFIAPIAELSSIDDATKDAVLEANFHTALDARYGSSNGLLFAAFLHPLSSLEGELARSALDQVASLVHTFGSHFTSGAIEFGHNFGNDREFGFDDDDDDGEDGPLLN